MGEAKPDLGLNWPVRSVRVKKGTWQICSRTRYRGRCAIVAADDPDLRGRTGFFDMVQSMRPMGRPKTAHPKAPLTMRVDANVLAAMRATGQGWQTRVNALLGEAVASGKF